MSLKAKLEAVIYAAEEPVTLAQLAVLFLMKRCNGRRSRRPRLKRRTGEPAAAELAALPLLNEAFPSLELEPGGRGGGSCEPGSEPAAEATPETGAEAAGESADENSMRALK